MKHARIPRPRWAKNYCQSNGISLREHTTQDLATALPKRNQLRRKELPFIEINGKKYWGALLHIVTNGKNEDLRSILEKNLLYCGNTINGYGSFSHVFQNENDMNEKLDTHKPAVLFLTEEKTDLTVGAGEGILRHDGITTCKDANGDIRDATRIIPVAAKLLNEPWKEIENPLNVKFDIKLQDNKNEQKENLTSTSHNSKTPTLSLNHENE